MSDPTQVIFYAQVAQVAQHTLAQVAAENARLRQALRFGATLQYDLVASRLPPEWSAMSGVGRMLAALGCKSVRLDDEARAALGA